MMIMIKKETLKAYLDGVQHQYDCDDNVQEVFKAIHGDNYNITFISEKYSNGMHEVMEDFLGHVSHDCLQWWMWETNVGIGKNCFPIETRADFRGVDPHIFVGDELVHNLDSFDKLYDYLTTLDLEEE
jgi:hypothetical protein